MATPLYRRHSPALAAAYADVENHALNQGEALAGTPGSVSVRENATGTRFYVRQYRDHEGTKRDQYIAGPEGAPEARRIAEEWRGRVEEARELLVQVRLLAREGYSLIGPKHFAAVAALANGGLFRAGGVLVGTHAFEVIVNRMGIRASAFPTEDVDLARPGKLAFDTPLEEGLLGLLRTSGIDFVAVPPLGRKQPSTSYKERGRSRFTFDLLVPASGDEVGTRAVPEMDAHATALPYLQYLVRETQTGTALSNHGVAAVRIPLPERFALHKLIVAELRTGRPEKSAKDLRQAGALIAALGEIQPGALEAAFAATPKSARAAIRKSLEKISADLAAHPESWEEISSAAG